MQYQVNVLTPCDNEEEMSAVIAAALTAVMRNKTRRPGNNLTVRNLRRIPSIVPEWGRVGRQERFELKL